MSRNPGFKYQNEKNDKRFARNFDKLLRIQENSNHNVQIVVTTDFNQALIDTCKRNIDETLQLVDDICKSAKR